MTDEELRKAARKNLKSRNDFKVMLAIFAVIAVFLIAIWFFSTGGVGYFWPAWPILGFTIAAVFGGLDAYGMTRRHDHRVGRRRRDRAHDPPVGRRRDAGGVGAYSAGPAGSASYPDRGFTCPAGNGDCETSASSSTPSSS